MKTRKDSSALFSCTNCGQELGPLGQSHLTNEPDESQTWSCNRSQHTPTPWRVVTLKDGDCAIYPNLEGYQAPIAVGITKENAAYIVKCVNAHEELLAVVRWLSDEIDENGQGNIPDALVSAVNKAIGKTEGEII